MVLSWIKHNHDEHSKWNDGSEHDKNKAFQDRNLFMLFISLQETNISTAQLIYVLLSIMLNKVIMDLTIITQKINLFIRVLLGFLNYLAFKLPEK